MNDTTKSFLNALSDACFDADNLPTAKRTAMLKGIHADVVARNLAGFGVDASEVELTEEQWAKVLRGVSMSLSSAHAEA